MPVTTGAMKAAADAEATAEAWSAANRAFRIPELLEAILLLVAASEIEPESGAAEESRQPAYDRSPSRARRGRFRALTPEPQIRHIFSPIRLRAMSRDFRDTIDGSINLQRLRLQVPPQRSRRDFPLLKYGTLGPLIWLEDAAYFGLPTYSTISQGTLRLRPCGTLQRPGVRKDPQKKLRIDSKGSWRTIPCVADLNLVIAVRHEIIQRTSERINGIDRLRFTTLEADLGPSPTLGKIFDMMDNGGKPVARNAKARGFIRR